MNSIASRWLGTVAALALSALIFPGAADVGGVLLGSLMLTILYVLLRPLLLTLALPLNLLLAGLVTPFADALLIRWTAAWVGGLTLTYPQCVAVALLLSAAYWPYSTWKQRYLQIKAAGG